MIIVLSLITKVYLNSAGAFKTRYNYKSRIVMPQTQAFQIEAVNIFKYLIQTMFQQKHIKY
jgi:hypothetical protein